VHRYFLEIKQTNDLSLSTLWAITCFLAAAHENMFQSLKKLEPYVASDGVKLRELWNHSMERDRKYRQNFFECVVERANKANLTYLYIFLKLMVRPQLRSSPPNRPQNSPKRGRDGKPDDPNYNSIKIAEENYARHAKAATEGLMTFLKGLFPDENPLCVSYFDEAHELELTFWILLRLLQAQDPSIKMWYVFMGTKSSISYYAPTPHKREPFVPTCPVPPHYIAQNFL
jgi:hypothetical protein